MPFLIDPLINKIITECYVLPGTPEKAEPFGNGHINGTYRLTFLRDGGQDEYILQRINRYVFRDPAALMENTVRVTEYLKKQIAAEGGDPDRETVTVIPAADGRPFCTDENGDCWRMELFVRDTFSYDIADSPALMRETGLSFGRFISMFSGFPADTLAEIIPGFHDTAARFAQFKETLRTCPEERKRVCEEEIRFILDREDVALRVREALRDGRLPLRVTHNDTKINNILFDRATKKALCVIDLDTVMPGLVMHDFGDAIRTGACTAAEDEPDVSKVKLDTGMYEAYARGFLEGCGASLTPYEKETLPTGALVITLEQALRFLKDYLEGDPYYKTSYPGHNLVRARTQIKLVRELEKHWEETDALLRDMTE